VGQHLKAVTTLEPEAEAVELAVVPEEILF
jgi:hypothetical protein